MNLLAHTLLENPCPLSTVSVKHHIDLFSCPLFIERGEFRPKSYVEGEWGFAWDKILVSEPSCGDIPVCFHLSSPSGYTRESSAIHPSLLAGGSLASSICVPP